jgi:hypothetical protein
VLDLILLVLAVFWAWEGLLPLLPSWVPDAAKAGLVAALAFGFTYLPRSVLLALAGAGAVGLLHVAFVRPKEQATTVARAGRGRIPGLP